MIRRFERSGKCSNYNAGEKFLVPYGVKSAKTAAYVSRQNSDQKQTYR